MVYGRAETIQRHRYRGNLKVWPTDQPTNPLTGVGARDANASKKSFCWSRSSSVGLSKLTRARQIVFCWLLSTQSRGHRALCEIQKPNNWKLLLVDKHILTLKNWIFVTILLNSDKYQFIPKQDPICPQMRFPKKESVTHLNRQLQIQEMLEINPLSWFCTKLDQIGQTVRWLGKVRNQKLNQHVSLLLNPPPTVQVFQIYFQQKDGTRGWTTSFYKR